MKMDLTYLGNFWGEYVRIVVSDYCYCDVYLTTVETEYCDYLGTGPKSHNILFLSQVDINCSIKNPNQG